MSSEKSRYGSLWDEKPESKTSKPNEPKLVEKKETVETPKLFKESEQNSGENPNKDKTPKPKIVQKSIEVAKPKMGKRGNPDYTRATILIRHDIYKQVKMAALEDGEGSNSIDISDLIEEWATSWLAQRKTRRK